VDSGTGLRVQGRRVALKGREVISPSWPQAVTVPRPRRKLASSGATYHVPRTTYHGTRSLPRFASLRPGLKSGAVDTKWADHVLR